MGRQGGRLGRLLTLQPDKRRRERIPTSEAVSQSNNNFGTSTVLRVQRGLGTSDRYVALFAFEFGVFTRNVPSSLELHN